MGNVRIVEADGSERPLFAADKLAIACDAARERFGVDRATFCRYVAAAAVPLLTPDQLGDVFQHALAACERWPNLDYGPGVVVNNGRVGYTPPF